MKPGVYIQLLKTRVERESWRTWIIYATTAHPYTGREFEQPIRRVTTVVPGRAKRTAREMVGTWWPYEPGPLYEALEREAMGWPS